LKICVKNSEEFREKASNALEQIKSPSALDWYTWWFGKIERKSKKIFGMLLIGLIVLLVMAVAYISATVETLSSVRIAGFSLAISMLFVVLVLPSLRKAKVGGYLELEVVPFAPPPGEEIEVVIPWTDYYGVH